MSNPIEPNITLSHYRILSKLGAGGMGEVYLAQDISELGRTVALKILPSEVARDKDRLQRFTQEARTVSNLNHPNILTVYEFGQTDSVSFMATEYVDGVTLRQHLSNRHLKLVDVLDVAIQIVAALNAAHEAGITHRDLKPENVMLRRDHIVKVLDFGLAKPTTPPTANQVDSEAGTKVLVHTEPGVVMGTASYMSPEQSEGKRIDHRTDIWSVGVVLYEMIAGVVPFEGKDIHRQIIAIQEQEPLPLSQHVDGVPERLEEIVIKCLAKEKDERYQTAKDLLIDLRNLRRKLDVDAEIERTVAPGLRSTSAVGSAGTHHGAPARTTSSAEYVVSGIKAHKLAIVVLALILIAIGTGAALYWRTPKSQAPFESIAILPFENKSNLADTEYLSDGLAESLIFRLSQLPNLKVSPRSSVFRYKGKEIDAEKVGTELGVDAVMSGRMIQRGDNLEISVELVDVKNRKSLWGEQYVRKMSDLLATQREIASAIANKLQLKLSGDEKGLSKRYTDNNEAYQLYLKGQYHYAKRTKADLDKSIEEFRQAIELDPNFALAHVGISGNYQIMPSYGYMSGIDANPHAKASAQRALEIDPNLAEAHSAYAAALTYVELKWEESEREYKRALELNPNVSAIHYGYAMNYLLPRKRLDEAIFEVKRALDLEPLSIPMGANLAGLYIYSRKYDLALEQARKVIALEPNHITAKIWLGRAYVANGMYSDAITLYETTIAPDATASDDFIQILGYSLAKAGRRSEAEKVLRKIDDFAGDLYWDRYGSASIYAALGEKDKAFAELEKSFAARDWGIARLSVDPFLDPLRDDPRFKDLVRRMRLPE